MHHFITKKRFFPKISDNLSTQHRQSDKWERKYWKFQCEWVFGYWLQSKFTFKSKSEIVTNKIQNIRKKEVVYIFAVSKKVTSSILIYHKSLSSYSRILVSLSINALHFAANQNKDGHIIYSLYLIYGINSIVVWAEIKCSFCWYNLTSKI